MSGPEIEGSDELYELEPRQFVAARDVLVRRLKSEGRRDEAAQIAALRRPSPVAWALNQLARQEPDLLERALAAGERLREATEAAVGGDASMLRSATAEDRVASEAAVDDAQRRLGASGPGSRQQIAATLRAAVLEVEVAQLLRRGVLATDHQAGGFGFAADFGFGTDIVPATPKRDRSPPRRTTESEPPSETSSERKRREAQELEEARKRERRAELETRVRELGERASELALAAERSESIARAAREEADAAAAELADAQRELEQA